MRRSPRRRAAVLRVASSIFLCLFLGEGVGAASARHELAILVVDVRLAAGKAAAAAHHPPLHRQVALERGLVIIHAQIHGGRGCAEMRGEGVVGDDVHERGEDSAMRVAARRIHDPFLAPGGFYRDAGLSRLEHFEPEPLVKFRYAQSRLQFFLGHHLDMVGAFADNFHPMDAVNLGDLTRAADSSSAALIDCRDWQNPATLTYGALEQFASAMARGLLARGFERGERVAIVSANCSEFVAAYLGIMRAGLVAVPLNHKLPRATLEIVLEDCAPRLVLYDADRRALLPPGIQGVEFASEEWRALQDSGPFVPVVPAPREPAMILYTSGSSGRPKGVVLTHEGHLWAVRMRLRGGPYDRHRLLIAAPLFHMNGLGTLKFALAAGATVVLLPQFETRRYIEAIERFACTWLTAVPPMLAMMFRERALLDSTDVSSVTAIRMGSAPVSERLRAQINEAFPSARVLNVYGTTEAGPVVFGPDPQGRPKPDAALGWPQPGVELKLVQGELWQRTPALMLGYFNDPERTAAVLTPDRWYKSGDVFRRDENGCYWFVGRNDDMFVSGGENIFPSEVELVLARHPDVAQACVVPVPDEIKGTKPVAFVVPRAGSHPEEQAIKRFVLDNAPAYQHPRRVFFLPELPLAGTNKVDRKALESIALKEFR